MHILHDYRDNVTRCVISASFNEFRKPDESVKDGDTSRRSSRMQQLRDV